ncbi:MAG: hypothetical protein JWQ69_4689 [Pseudomonas sp.]|nr:hypothetical protein [Pseudomonas sp.]
MLERKEWVRVMEYQFKHLASSIVLGVALIAAASVAHAASMSLDDFVPPVSGGADKPETAASKAGDVVTAENMQDGLGYAYQQLIADSGQGILTVKTKTGMGVISASTESYTRYENLTATLLSKRGAYFKAFNSAQAQMVKYFEGLVNNCTSATSSKVLTLDTGKESVANTASGTAESCKETAKGILAGYVTYSVNDNDADDQVTITLASSTKTRGALDRISSAVVSTADPKKAFEYIAKEISLGIVPPMGAKLINDPVTGESIVIGFGSSIIRQNKDKKVLAMMGKMADDQSRIRANNSLVAFLNGSQVYWQGGFDEAQGESAQQFEVPVGSDGKPQTPVAFDDTRHVFLNSVSHSDDFKSVTAGKLPAGVITKTFPSEDGYWSNTISIYRPSATAQAQQEGRENRQASGKLGADGVSGQQQTQGHTIAIEGGVAPGSANPKGPSGSVVRDNDF